ncbi:MAG TPA: glycosyltransferase family 2 protein [Thermoanaerobaculia bacterium]|nr:glycosyltransferase family 2 protein [Thermoanaerobaculia bacterium]
MKLISVVTPCYNEEDNVRELYRQVREVFASLGRYRYEHIFIDNASTDKTVAILKEIASEDRNVKIIVNRRNFGQIRSPHHAFLTARGDAVISLAADLQDPPALIPQFIDFWEKDFKVVLGVKRSTEDSMALGMLRGLYYRLASGMSDVELVRNATGFGLYDQEFVSLVRALDDPYPYTRGLISEFGFPYATIPYDQPQREHGVTKNNWFTLYDVAMTGITSHSKLPLRLATMTGFALAAICLLIALGYFVYKLLYWNEFPVGIAPIVMGLFFAMAVQLVFLGLMGEYIAVIHTRLLHRPLVVEKERVNFEPQDISVEEDQHASVR